MSKPIFSRAGLTAKTDQVMANAAEILPQHIATMREFIDAANETEAFETQVIIALNSASPEQLAIMYAQALLSLIRAGAHS
jgi:hypothetical protein